MQADESEVWGCLECGAIIEERTTAGTCTACGDGLVVELGGEPAPDKAQALIAWARRDATEQIETWGMVAGAALAALGAVLATVLAGGGGLPALVALLYAAAIGAILGRLWGTRIHRLVRPHSQLQPIHNEALRRKLRLGIILLVVVPAAAYAALVLATGETDLRRGAQAVLNTAVRWLND